MSVRLGRFMERSGVLPATQFAYRKSLGTCDALLWVSHTLQSALESGHEARIVKIDFSVVYTDTVSLKPSQHVMIDGCWSKLVDVVSGVPQGSVLGPL